MLSSFAAVRPEPEWTPSATVRRYWPNDAGEPDRFRLSGSGARIRRCRGVCLAAGAGARRRVGIWNAEPLRALRRRAAAAARALRVAERQPHLEGEIGAQEVGRSAQSGRMTMPHLVFAEAQMVEQDVARLRSRSTSCSAGHDGAASSGASNSFSIQAENRFSVARFQVLRTGQTLPAAARGRGGLSACTAMSRVIVPQPAHAAHERRVPGAGGRRRDLGEPEIRRAAVPVARFGGDAAVGRDQRELAVERLLGGEDDAQRRALPRRDRRRQDRDLGRVVAGALRLRVRCREKADRPRSATMPSQPQQTGVLVTMEPLPGPSTAPPVGRAGSQDTELAAISQLVVSAALPVPLPPCGRGGSRGANASAQPGEGS